MKDCGESVGQLYSMCDVIDVKRMIIIIYYYVGVHGANGSACAV